MSTVTFDGDHDRQHLGRKPRQQPVPSVRSGSHSTHEGNSRPGRKPRLHKPSRDNYPSFGRSGLTASAEINYSRPAYGSIPIDGGQFYWCAFRRLRDWMEGGDPLDSGFCTNEITAHDYARGAVRHYLSNHEPLPPMPEAFVQAHYDRLTAEQTAREQAKRWLERIEDNGAIAGYEWTEVCETNEFDVSDFDVNPNEAIDLDALDLDVEEAA